MYRVSIDSSWKPPAGEVGLNVDAPILEGYTSLAVVALDEV